MSFKIINSSLQNCFLIEFNQLNDQRGHFTKIFHVDMFKNMGINMEVKEEYFTFSLKNVFRGLHFQLPPKDIDKLVFCVSGQVIDYVVDIRIGSPTFGKYDVFELNGNCPKAVFVPKGFAHGFYVISENALMQYKVSDVFDKDCDYGISYKTFDFAKDIVTPILSDRDYKFITLNEFDSPFKF